MSGELSKDGSVLVCGCGVFGIATAYGLANAGYKDVTVIDRGNELPAMDAAR